ncbi:MAG TPA: hypothetical protein VKY45_01750 [Marinilabiliaceae bacterium]|nr:hypothetical protein [Marinilabiliaceae bacterium]
MSGLLKKVPGGTVLEVVVALIIVSIAFGLTGTFFTSIFGSSKRMVKIQAWHDMNEHINRIRNSSSIESLEIDRGLYYLKTEVERLNEESGLSYVKVSSLDKHDVLIVQRKFFVDLGDQE